jgi:hypothetical protein
LLFLSILPSTLAAFVFLSVDGISMPCTWYFCLFYHVRSAWFMIYYVHKMGEVSLYPIQKERW